MLSLFLSLARSSLYVMVSTEQFKSNDDHLEISHFSGFHHILPGCKFVGKCIIFMYAGWYQNTITKRKSLRLVYHCPRWVGLSCLTLKITSESPTIELCILINEKSSAASRQDPARRHYGRRIAIRKRDSYFFIYR